MSFEQLPLFSIESLQSSMVSKNAVDLSSPFLFKSLFSPASSSSFFLYQTVPVGDGTWFFVSEVSALNAQSVLTQLKLFFQFQALCLDTSSPSELLEGFNKSVFDSSLSFSLSLWVSFLDHQTGQMTYSFAGQPFIYFLRTHHEPSLLTALPTAFLGSSLDNTYVDSTFVLSFSDRLLFLSSSLLLEILPTGATFHDLLHDSFAAISPFAFLAFFEEVSSFVSELSESFSSDRFFAVLEWTKHHTSVSNQLGIHFKNDLSELSKLHQVIELFGSANDITLKHQLNITLCLEELLTNIMYYGYEDHHTHLIELHLLVKNGLFSATIIDDGVPFNPLDRPEFDPNQSLDERDIGGLGIHFVTSLMSNPSYKRTENKNIFEFSLTL